MIFVVGNFDLANVAMSFRVIVSDDQHQRKNGDEARRQTGLHEAPKEPRRRREDHVRQVSGLWQHRRASVPHEGTRLVVLHLV
jgi:hypothetical protein